MRSCSFGGVSPYCMCGDGQRGHRNYPVSQPRGFLVSPSQLWSGLSSSAWTSASIDCNEARLGRWRSGGRPWISLTLRLLCLSLCARSASSDAGQSAQRGHRALRSVEDVQYSLLQGGRSTRKDSSRALKGADNGCALRQIASSVSHRDAPVALWCCACGQFARVYSQ